MLLENGKFRPKELSFNYELDDLESLELTETTALSENKPLASFLAILGMQSIFLVNMILTFLDIVSTLNPILSLERVIFLQDSSKFLGFY